MTTSKPAGQQQNDRPPKHLLVAEDDSSLLSIIKFNLEAVGFRVTVAHDGREAWELAQRNHFDLVLTDYGMPETVGPELCRQLRQDDRYAETPLMLMSALHKSLDLLSLQDELGLDAVFPKPFSVADLVGKIRERLATNDAPPT